MSRRTVFISGHTDITPDQFVMYYTDQLANAIRDNCRFIMGNAPGADSMALDALLRAGVPPADITVYIFRPDKDFSIGYYQSLCVQTNQDPKWKSFRDRDAQMTRDSDYDVYWLRSADECVALYGEKYRVRVSGTEANIRRRAKESLLKL